MSKTNTALLAKFLLTFLAALLTFGFWTITLGGPYL